jgi:hypothetical protein
VIALPLLPLAGAGVFGDLDGQQPFQQGCLDVDVVPDTVPYSVAKSAREAHARTYSAVAALEREVLKLPDNGDDGQGVFHMGIDGLMGVTELPSIACGELGMQGYDVSAYNLVLAGRGKRFGLFYSAAGNSGIVYPDGITRTVKHGGSMIIGHYYAFTAPLWGSRVINADEADESLFASSFSSITSDSDVGGISLDYVAGASVDAEIVQIGAGYVGSQGAYVHLVQPHSGAFLELINDLRDAEDIDPLRFLQTGIEALWLLRNQSSATDAYFSRYQLVLPSGAVTGGEPVTEEEETFSLTEIRQRDLIGDGYLDVELSTQIKPDPAFYEGTVRVHTPNYHPDIVLRRDESLRDFEGGGAVAVGLINLPERPWFGVEGGVKPTLNAELYGLAVEETGTWIRASFKLNDPDTLILFPYAQGAWQFHLSISMRGD